MECESPGPGNGKTVEKSVEAALDEHGVGAGIVVVAFSGGPDSTALLLALHAVASLRRPAPTLVAAHLDHGLRPDSGAEAEAAGSVATSLGLAFISQRVVVTAAPGEGGLEMAARRERYRFLATVAREQGAGHVALGHHLDDRVETVLHRLLQGANLSGLTGIPRRRGLPGSGGAVIIRPLLDLPRSEILSWLERRGASFTLDPSNEGEGNARARLRAHVLPVLEQAYPQARASLLRLEALARDLENHLEASFGPAGVPAPADGAGATLPRRLFRGAGTEGTRILLGRLAAHVEGDGGGVRDAAVRRVLEVLARDDERPRRVPLGDGREVVVDAESVTMRRQPG